MCYMKENLRINCDECRKQFGEFEPMMIVVRKSVEGRFRSKTKTKGTYCQTCFNKCFSGRLRTI